jgi:predicted nucleic acid-binding protein
VIFLDTSAIYAMADKADPNHVIACSKFDLALKSKETFLLHNYILAESAALLQARLGLQSAILFLNDAKAFEIEWVNLVLHHEALKELERIARRGISFIDCASFVVMRRKSIHTAFAFDTDFQDQGFSIY